LLLDLYGWLKYELLPDKNPVTNAVLRKMMVETKIQCEGWDAADVELIKDEDNFRKILIHKPTRVKVTVTNATKDIDITL
jgi:hypothetical protein